MALIVISPEAEDPCEHAVLAQLFAAGLASYHLRKPTWSRDQLVAWLRALPVEFHSRIVLHTHHDLAGEFTLGGVHERETANPNCHLIGDNLRSRAVHDLPQLRASIDGYDRLLVSPIFPAFSKPGYGPTEKLPEAELRAALALPRRAEVIALGGIDSSRIQVCRELGFDGVAVLGAIWQAADPVAAFSSIQKNCGSELARDSVTHRAQARSHA
ncbi:MAG: thiamine phosphate synthase [Opitutaceae bacterium]